MRHHGLLMFVLKCFFQREAFISFHLFFFPFFFFLIGEKQNQKRDKFSTDINWPVDFIGALPNYTYWWFGPWVLNCGIKQELSKGRGKQNHFQSVISLLNFKNLNELQATELPSFQCIAPHVSCYFIRLAWKLAYINEND